MLSCSAGQFEQRQNCQQRVLFPCKRLPSAECVTNPRSFKQAQRGTEQLNSRYMILSLQHGVPLEIESNMRPEEAAKMRSDTTLTYEALIRNQHANSDIPVLQSGSLLSPSR